MNLETEIPEILFKKMQDFIESSPEVDQHSFISSALNNFLFKNGCEDRQVIDSYLNDVFESND